MSQQIDGKVIDESGSPLPYVNIHIKDSSVGTTTNLSGEFVLKSQNESVTLIFQYVGYKTIEKVIDLDQSVITLDIQMTPEIYETGIISISANAEDPAYAIIRQAQAKRKEYLSRMSNYTCDAYVRGLNKVLDAPEKILGQDIGDMDGNLDSTRQGIVYLSESVSKLYVLDGSSKEVLYSSKVSGNDQGYSFNSAQEMEFNFYEKTLDLNRKIISPIAPSALRYYNYELIGTKYESDGQLVNKIKVIPKSDYSPTLYGHIFINEDLWNIHSLELGVTAQATQIPFIDSLTFQQIFIPLDEDRWMPMSNVIRFKMGALGFKVGGNFACVYSNYELDNTDPDIFNKEVFVLEKEANQRTEKYWDSLRPIPLTIEEKIDYHRKDSIRIVRESPEYLDSIDRAKNKLKWDSFILGHTFQNSKKRTTLSYKSPLNVQVNTIQGWVFNPELSWRKRYDKNGNRFLSIQGKVDYGLSEKVIRPNLGITYRADRINNLSFYISGGRQLVQYNRNQPISNTLNTLLTHTIRRNYLKAYDLKYFSVKVNRYLSNALYGNLSVAYEDRTAVTNNYNGGLFYKDSREFTSNNPLNSSSDELAFSNNKAVIILAALRIRLGSEIWSYPDQKFRTRSDWPTLWLGYKKAIPLHSIGPDYDLIYASLSKTYSLGTIGNFSFYSSGGKFIRNKNIPFTDYVHFLVNETHIGNPFKYRNSFMLLPYYSHSTNDAYIHAHFQHHFNGFFLSRIPLIRNLKWHLVGGVKYLNATERPSYSEIHLGIDNIGFHIIRPLRVDFVWVQDGCDGNIDCVTKSGFGVVVGVKAVL